VTSHTLRLSIVIPVYNEQSHITACLAAIAAQTIMPFEVLVIDNNCTDNTIEIAKKFPFVKVIKEPVQGISHARNKGFNSAKGDIIGRIDADTLIPTTWISDVLKFYKNGDNDSSALTGGGYFYNIRTPKFNGWLQGQFAFRTNRFIVGYYILWGSNMVMPSAMWQAVKATTCQRNDIHEDMDLAIHCHKNGYRITYHESLRVGVKLKRVWEDRFEQRKHMARWPRTLRLHGYKLWWLGSVGNVVLVIMGEPYIFLSEAISRLFRRPHLPS